MSDNQESRKELAADEIDQLLAGVADGAADEDEEHLLADFQDALRGGAAGSPAVEEDDGDLSDLDAFLDDFEQSLDAVDEIEQPAAAAVEDEPLDDRLPDDELPEAPVEVAAEADDDLLMEPEPVATAPADELEAPELELDEPEPDDVVEAAAPVEQGAVSEGAGLPDASLEELDHDFDALDEDDLNLADDEEPLPEPPVSAGAVAGDLFTDTVADMAPPEPERHVTSTPPPQTATPDGRPLLAAVAALVLAIASGAAVGWVTMGVKGEVAELSAAVEALKGRSAGGEADPSRVEQLSREVGQLNQRLSELALLIEGPMSHVRESNRRELESIFSRLEATEKQLSGFDTRLGELKRTPAPTVAATAKPAPKASPKPADSGTWAVNLVSLSSRNTAERELSALRQAGIKAELQQVTIRGKQWFRLRVTGFDSKDAAGRYAQQVRGKTRIEIDPWLDRI